MDIFSIELQLPFEFPTALPEQILRYIKPLTRLPVDIHTPPRQLEKLSRAVSGMRHVPIRYDHTPLLRHVLISNIHQTRQVFLPVLFCKRNYFKQHKSWGYPIIHFMDDQPEIYPITSSDTEFHRVFGYPEDISAIIVVREEESKPRAKNMIRHLQRETGLLEFKINRPFNGHIVILRKMYLYYRNGLKYRINIHDDFLLRHHAKKINQFVPPGAYEGAWLDGDTFFEEDDFLSYTPELSRNYQQFSGDKLLHDWAVFLIRKQNQNTIRHPRLERQYTAYLNGTLLPKLNYIHPETTIKASLTNPFFCHFLPVGKTVYRIDDNRLIYDPQYRRDVHIFLKRIATHHRLHGSDIINIQMGDLLNIGLSFREKALFYLLLAFWGATRFQNRFRIDADTADLFKMILETGSERLAGHQHFQSGITHLLKLIQISRPVDRILVLFPDSDAEWSFLYDVLAILERQHAEFDLIAPEVLLQNAEFNAQTRRIECNNREYALLLLPGLHHLALDVLQKIVAMYMQGALCVTIGQLPHISETNSALYATFHNALWLNPVKGRALNFKTSEQNGYSYFISQATAMEHILREHTLPATLHFFNLPEGLCYFERHLDNTIYIFLLNTTARSVHPGRFSVKQQGTLSVWHGGQAPRLKRLKNYTFSPASDEFPLEIPEFSFVVFQWRALKTTEENDHIQEIPNQDWHVEIDGQEHLSRLGDRSVEAPYNHKTIHYSKIVDIDAKLLNNHKVFLNLGMVRDWCYIRINDKDTVYCLYPPFEVDITPWLVPGKNGITVSVGHRLSNYLAMHDLQEQQVIPVLPYGLLGPVTIIYRTHSG